MQCLRRWTPWLALGLAWGALAQPPDAVGLDGERSDAVAAVSTGREPLRFAQLSRDELFGTRPADKAAGKPAQKPIRVSGFVEGLVAYTYGDPSHWSRAVGRLQVAAQGGEEGGLRWKLSGRADADIVYFTSGFYPDPVKRNQRADFFFRENYLDFAQGDWDFRLGAQQIVWGEVVGLFFADVVSARDMREFLLPGFDVIRIPQWAARAEYTSGDHHLELVWIPVPVFDEIGKPGSEFYPAPLDLPVPDDVAELFRPPERPARKLSNGNYGVRANTLVAGWDLSAFYYRSFSTQPTFHREATGDPARPFEFRPRYDRISQVGATFSKDFDDFVLRGEVVYARGQRHALADLAAVESVVERSTLDYIVGADIPLPHDTRINVQVFQRVYSGGSGDLAIQNGSVGASVFLTTRLTSTIEPQILWLQYFSDGGGLIRPRVNWRAAPNVTVGAGVDIFTGPADGYFGRYNDRDRVYAELRYSF